MIGNKKVSCPLCTSPEWIVKSGVRHNKNGSKQVYYCKRCDKKFTNGMFKRMKYEPKIITSSLEMFIKGVSPGKIRKHLYLLYTVKPSRNTIIYWAKKYKKYNAFTEGNDKYLG
jgi:transposase-like protein